MRFQPSSYSRSNPTPTSGLVDSHGCTYDVLEDGALRLVSGDCGEAGSLVINYSDEWKALLADMLAIEPNKEKLIAAYGSSEVEKVAKSGNSGPFYKKPMFWAALGGTAVLGTAAYMWMKSK